MQGRRASENNRPLVSVIVPAWNAEETLAETLASAFGQTYRNIEIVIVDDGSTDRTAEIALDLCANDPRARLVRQANGGLSAARNRAVKESKGEWIAPLDADDLWHPTKIEKQVGAALERPDPPGFVYCWYQHIDEQGYVLSSSPRWAFSGAALKRLAYENMIHTVLLSREATAAAGGYDETLRACEDVMIQLRIAREFPVAVVPEHLVGYRKRDDSMSRDTGLVLGSWRRVLDRLIAEGADISPQLRRWIEAFFRKAEAEQALAKGDYGHALKSFAGAVRRDPARWGPYALYRIARTAARLARGRRPRPEKLHFSSIPPSNYVSPDPDELRLFARLLERFERSRLSRLERQESLDPYRRGAA